MTLRTPTRRLGSVEGIAPPLRSFTVAELLLPSSQPAPSGEAAEFPTAALPDEHPAVVQFRRLGYVAIEDALSGAALERVVGTFRRAQPHAEAVWQAMTQDHTSRAFLAGDSKETVQQYFDLPREDVVDPIEAWNSGAWGGFQNGTLRRQLLYAIRLDSPPERTRPAHGKVYCAYRSRLTATVRVSVTPSSDRTSKS
jgi:hypothetical protein